MKLLSKFELLILCSELLQHLWGRGRVGEGGIGRERGGGKERGREEGRGRYKEEKREGVEREGGGSG